MTPIPGLREIPEIREARTRIVEATLSVMMWASGVVGLLLVVFSPRARLRQLFLAGSVALVAWLVRRLARRAGYRVAAWCFITLFLALFTVAAWTAGGMTAPAVHAYLVLVILAAQMLGRSGGYVTAGLIALLGAGLAWGQTRGTMPPAWVQHTPWSRWWLLVVYSGLVAIFLGLAMRTLEMALGYAGVEVGERRRAEAELQAAQADLERKVAERTEELARTVSRLEAQTAELKAAREAQSRFFALVSHELRTPLTSVRASLGLLTHRGDLPPEARPLADIATRNTLRLLNLTNELLDLEKVEAGQFEVRKDQVDLREPIRHAVEAMQGLAQERNHRLLLTSPDLPMFVMGDATRLEQVGMNLLSNALKHAKGPDPVAIRLEARPEGPWVGVSNAGNPIPPEFQDRIFQTFHQLEPQAGTSGLGLSLSKAIIEAHGGRIGFESGAEATTFFFQLKGA